MNPLVSKGIHSYLEKGTNRAVVVALANKNARIAWSLMAHNTKFDVTLASTPLLKSAASFISQSAIVSRFMAK